MKTKLLLTLVMLISVLLPGGAHGYRYVDGFNRYSSAFNRYSSATGSGPAIRTVAVQPWDGKVVVGGDFFVKRSDIVQRNLARLNTDGTFDSTFTASAGDPVNAIAIQSDRSILIGGSFRTVRSGVSGSVTELARYGVARLNGEKGDLDNFTGRLPDGSVVNSILLHPDGSILIGGAFQKTVTVGDATACRNLARISAADGAFLNCYSGGVTGGDVNALALQDGRVVAGGAFTSPRVRLARFLPEGNLDENFALSPDGTVWALGVQADGKVLLGGGFTAISGRARFRMARFDSAAALDDAFQPVLNGQVSAIAVQPDGNILIGGAFAGGLGRLGITGVADPNVAPLLNGVVNAVALQPDEKFLAAGQYWTVAGKDRSMLARFYPYGTLDDDVKLPPIHRVPTEPQDDAFLTAASVAPDGSVTIGGYFGFIDGIRRLSIARLHPDWTKASEEEFPAPHPSDVIGAFAPRPDGRMTMGGAWLTLDLAMTDWQPAGAQLMSDGKMDSTSNFNANMKALAGEATGWSYIISFVHIPGGGSYAAGELVAVDGTSRYLVKINENGELAPLDRNAAGGFDAEVYNPVCSVLVLTDSANRGKIVVQTRQGEILRLRPDGSRDPSWVIPTQTAPGGCGHILSQQTDGQILVGGGGTSFEKTIGEKSWKRQVVRLNNNKGAGIADGSIDESFLVGFRRSFMAGTQVENAFELGDGTILVVGAFDRVTDSTGVEFPRCGVALLDKTGKLLPLDLGYFDTWGYPTDLLDHALVQRDGKLILLGSFNTIDGDATLQSMVRVSLGWWATKDLEVAPDGKSVILHRGGMSPRLWRVTFEYSPDGVAWKELGDAERSGSDWILNKDLDLVAEAGGYYRYRYIRARGYVIINNTSGDMELTARAFYLKPVVKVRAVPVQRPLGADNGEFQPEYRFLDDSAADPAESYGAPSFTTSADSGSPLGRYPVAADVRNVYSPLYTFVPEQSELTVIPVGPKLDQSITFTISNKTYGAQDFPLNGRALPSNLAVSYSSSNTNVATIVGGNSIHIRGAGTTTITATQPGNALYNAAAPVALEFKVLKATLTARADSKARAYRTPNPPLTVSYSGFVYNQTSTPITGTPVLSTTADLQSPVGDYPITVDVSGMTAADYSFLPEGGTLSVVKSCQEIVFPQPGDRTYGDPPFQLIAYSCSGLPITFTSKALRVARVDGSLVTITGAGSAEITASQQGTDDLEKAPDVTRTVIVHKGRQEITFPALQRQMLGDPPLLLRATASSGLRVTYQSSELSVAGISGSSAELVGPGTTVITATQEGSPNYNPAIPVSQPLIVAAEGEPPLLSLSTLATGTVTADPVFNVTGSASDPSGIAGVTVNGVRLADPAAMFSAAVALTGGENRIDVSASDRAGNKASRELHVTLDAAAPYLVISGPADNSVVNAPFCTVSGTASAGSAVSLAVNGAAAHPLYVSGGSFTGNGYLREGVNTIVVSAELAGRTSTLKRSVTLAPGSPHAAITEPSQDIRTEKETLLLRGTAGAVGSEVTLQLDVDGSSFTPSLQGGIFQQAVTLVQSGEHRITATVTDRSGNSSVARRNVIRMERVLGDLNGDALVDLRDALAALRISLEIAPATPQALEHGDVAPLVNGAPRPDGRIDVGDVLLMLRKVVGLVQF